MAAEYVVRMGRRIAQAREEAGMSQNDLSRALPGKVGAQMVSKWERGLHEPRSDTLEAIAHILKKPIAYFIADEPQEGTPDLMGALNGEADKLDEALDMLRRLLSRQEALAEAVASLVARLDADQKPARPDRRQAS